MSFLDIIIADKNIAELFLKVFIKLHKFRPPVVRARLIVPIILLGSSLPSSCWTSWSNSMNNNLLLIVVDFEFQTSSSLVALSCKK